MSSDLTRLLHDTAVAPLDPVDVGEVVTRVGQRRRRQRAGTSVAVAAFGLAIATGISLVVETPEPLPIVQFPQPDTARTGPGDDGDVVEGETSTPGSEPVEGPPAAPAGERSRTQPSGPEGGRETGSSSSLGSAAPSFVARHAWTFENGADGWGDGFAVGQRGGREYSGDPWAWAWTDRYQGATGAMVARITAGPAGCAGGPCARSRESVGSPALAVPGSARRVEVGMRYHYAAEPEIDREVVVELRFRDESSSTVLTRRLSAERQSLRATGPGWITTTWRVDVPEGEPWDEFSVGLIRLHDTDAAAASCVGEDRDRDACDFGFAIDEVTVTFLAE